MRSRFYQTDEELNPRIWHPTPIRVDPDPNPPLRVGAPVRGSTVGELYERYKREGRIEEFGRVRDQGR